MDHLALMRVESESTLNGSSRILRWRTQIEELYKSHLQVYICHCRPIREQITKMRWSLFGHILRRDNNIPAQLAMTAYFENDGTKPYRGRPPTNLLTTINKDIRSVSKNHYDHTYSLQLKELSTAKDLDNIRKLANDRETWQALTERIILHTSSQA